jgi:PDZ domain-containing protein
MEMTTTASVCRNVDTSEPILPSEGQPQTAGDFMTPPEAPARRHRLLFVVAATISSIFIVSGIVAGLVRIPYDTIGPGSAKVVNKLVTINGHESYPPAGQVLYTTVAVRERVSVLQALLGWLDGTTDVLPEKDIRGNIPADQYQELNVQAMSDSKSAAEALALARIGYTNLGAGAEVQSVADGSPAAGAKLAARDVIQSMDAKPIRTSEDAVNAIRAHKPGDVVRIRIDRAGTPTDLEATLTEAKDGTALLGVRLSTKIQLPFEIKIDSGQVVGPSAGLAYALELLDVLTPGELTGGAGVKVAATGELGANGAVGAIGGIAQKVTTVKRAGATAFLVPKENEAEARKHAGKNLKIYGVSSFDEALSVLGGMQGSNALALAKPTLAPHPA